MAQEPTSDYGYDLVHEEVARPGARERADERRPDDAVPSGAAPPDPAGDYGYDEAHDF